MKTLARALVCCMFGGIAFSCSDKEEPSPCLLARVVDVEDPCSGGVLLELKKEEFSGTNGFCGTPSFYRYVTVNNLPDNLKKEGATFSCRVKAAEGRICRAVYTRYEAATITGICSQPEAQP